MKLLKTCQKNGLKIDEFKTHHVPIKICIFALIFRIPLSDTEMDDLRAKSGHLGVNCIDIH